ncbi:hypothetical protein, partial [Thermus scotoductus]|uniref:hypothetical protein n=1 Tax=Thermus scotoductus TaxID=37636 RepID=UPI001290F7D9
MPRWIALLVLLGLAWAQYDLVVYGATPQGVAPYTTRSYRAQPVAYTHLTLPTIYPVLIPVVPVHFTNKHTYINQHI